MPLDHYISQVHLRKFYSQALGNRMYAIRKTDLKAFTPDSESVCRIMDGSTNAYLLKDRIIEDFLKTIEPNYSSAIESLSAGKVDSNCIHAIAGFVAFVVTCSPAGMRIQSEPLKRMVEHQAVMMDAQGAFRPPPAVLGSASLSKLLRERAVEFTIDPKYPQAIGIDSILKFVNIFGNCEWEILHNDSKDSPFFTSDFPVAIEESSDPLVLNRIVPLAPNLAIRIKPDRSIDRTQIDLHFPNFSCVSRHIGHRDLVKINTLLVRCAENTVFYRDNHPWMQPFVARNRHYRIEPGTRKLATPSGTLIFWTHRVVASASSVE
jgi:Protein of unknown function (DUF4238)